MILRLLLSIQMNMQDVYKNIDEYNVDKEHKILIVFDDMTGYMINDKKAKFSSTWIVY